MKVKMFSLAQYVEQALKIARYSVDEQGLVLAKVPGASGFFTQGESVEETRNNLRDVIEGNVIVALQLGLAIPRIEGAPIREYPWNGSRKHGKTHPPSKQNGKGISSGLNREPTRNGSRSRESKRSASC